MGQDAMIFVFWMLSFKPTFSLSSFTFIKSLFHSNSCSLSAIRVATAAAKSLQSCPTLCNPIDDSPPGSPIPGILQARTLEWAAISFSNAWKWKVKVKSLSHIWLLATSWTAAYQAPPSIAFSPIRVVSSAYLRVLIFLSAILIPACAKGKIYIIAKWSTKRIICHNYTSFIPGSKDRFTLEKCINVMASVQQSQ